MCYWLQFTKLKNCFDTLICLVCTTPWPTEGVTPQPIIVRWSPLGDLGVRDGKAKCQPFDKLRVKCQINLPALRFGRQSKVPF